MTRLLCLLVLVSAGASAQVPYDYLLTLEQTSSSSDPALHYVQPSTGVATPVRTSNTGGQRLRFASAVGLDPTNAGSIYFSGGLSTSIAAVLNLLTVVGTEEQSIASVTVSTPGTVGRFTIDAGIYYLVVTSPLQPGLWTAPVGGGTATRVIVHSGLRDVAAVNGKVYAVGLTGATATLEEYDPSNGQSRTVASGLPPYAALAPFAGQLVAGDDNGNVDLVDPTSGSPSRLLSSVGGPIVAMASANGTADFYYATANAVWDFQNTNAPVYRASGTLRDIATGQHDQASLLIFGSGCSGTNGRSPAVRHAGAPSIGNSGFQLVVGNALPGAMATLALGSSRQTIAGQPLPLQLDPYGIPSCALYTDVVLTLGLSVDGGGIGQVSVPIPPLPWKGAHFTGQFFVLDAGAPGIGIAASDGLEGIIR